MVSISHLVRIKAPVKAVFNCVASAAGIAAWFTDAHCAHYQQHETLILKFPHGEIRFIISNLISNAFIVWHCVSEADPWYGTDIEFEFEQQGNNTIVRFDHSGWKDVTDLFRDCSLSWAYFLESLKLLVETGKGTPESLAPPCEANT